MHWKVFKLRKENNKTQKEMAEIAKCHFTNYGKKERNKVVFTADEYHRLSEYFGVTIESIFLPENSINNARKKEEA